MTREVGTITGSIALVVVLLGSTGCAPKASSSSTPSPAGGSAYVGEYEWKGERFVVGEYDGQPRLFNSWYLPYVLRPDTAGVFRMPPRGRFADQLVWFWADMHAPQLTMVLNGVPYERRSVGPEDGGQLKIAPVRPVPELIQEALRATPPAQPAGLRAPDLVELTSLDSTVHLDIRYATTNNFAGTVFYTQARAFLQRPAAEALVRAHEWLRQRGYGLLIHDGYRPWYVTKTFWDAVPDSVHWMVANPAQGSKHNRGSAVDLTLYDLSTGQPVEMPGTYDEATRRSFANYPGGTTRQRRHRALLRTAMEGQGFEANPEEWWHFDFRDWRQYPVLNLKFEELR